MVYISSVQLLLSIVRDVLFLVIRNMHTSNNNKIEINCKYILRDKLVWCYSTLRKKERLVELVFVFVFVK